MTIKVAHKREQVMGRCKGNSYLTQRRHCHLFQVSMHNRCRCSTFLTETSTRRGLDYARTTKLNGHARARQLQIVIERQHTVIDGRGMDIWECAESAVWERANGGVERDDGLGEYLESRERKEETCGTTMREREFGIK